MTKKPSYVPILPSHIPLANAYLCVNCECVGAKATYCSACNSSVLISLYKLLNKVKESK